MRVLIAGLLIAAVLSVLVPAPAHAQTTEADVYVAQAMIDFDDKRYDEALCAKPRWLVLNKTDLVTEMVKEFTDLQGKIGGIYARELAKLLDQEPFNVAVADLYRSRFRRIPGVVYTAGVRHANHVAAAFRAAGMNAQAVSGETPKRELAEILLDQRIPGYQREIINIIGMGVVENLDDPEASRQHAMLEVLGDHAILRDLGSTNGTYVGQRKLEGAQPILERSLICHRGGQSY